MASAVPQSAPAASAARIGRARVLMGSVSFKDAGIPNLGNTYRSQLQLEDNTVVHAVVKDIPLRELANEVVAATLALELRLPVPRPFLAAADAKDLATTRAPKLPDGRSLLFASADVGSPSIAQIVRAAPNMVAPAAARVAAAIAATPASGEFYGFDAWVANVDRHTGNLLLGGNSVWLIDHGRSLTGDQWVVADLVSDKTYRHRLFEWLTPLLTESDKDRMSNECGALAARLVNVDITAVTAIESLPELLGQSDYDAAVEFLTNRIQHVHRLGAASLNRIA